MLAVTVVVYEGNFNGDIGEFIFRVDKNGLWDQWIAAGIGVKHLNKLDNTTFTIKSF